MNLQNNTKQKTFFRQMNLTSIVCKMAIILLSLECVNTLRPRQNGRYFPDDTFKRIFLNENVRISIKISLKFVPKGPINKIPALVQIMAWRRSGDNPLSEPMMVKLLTHMCVTWPQYVKAPPEAYLGPLLLTWFNFNPSMKLLIHSQTSTVQLLKFGNGLVISSHTLLSV